MMAACPFSNALYACKGTETAPSLPRILGSKEHIPSQVDLTVLIPLTGPMVFLLPFLFANHRRFLYSNALECPSHLLYMTCS